LTRFKTSKGYTLHKVRSFVEEEDLELENRKQKAYFEESMDFEEPDWEWINDCRRGR
jgi:hypothetical protein|tara:strand:- start:284 stop:454 length:171 start_codon:yes stop_codon:yes gene_type:complete